jgi:hypothetical protein
MTMNMLLAFEPSAGLSLVLGMAWKSAVILVGGGIVVLALGRSSAAVRHLTWTLALGGTLALLPLT